MEFNLYMLLKVLMQRIHFTIDFRYGIIDSSYRNQEHGMPYPCRGLFIIDPHKIVRMMSFHPWSMGRSTKELLRTIDSLQLTQKFEHKV